MYTPTIILAGLANNKTSLGEVFRRYVECFKMFSTPDVFDLQMHRPPTEMTVDIYPPFQGVIDHDIKYIHTTFSNYNKLKAKTIKILPIKHQKKIGYFVWESSEMHEKDIQVFEDFDEIWTASNYCKDIFSQYTDNDKIKVVPHPIPVPEKLPKKYTNFTILIIGNISSNMDRKNIRSNLEVAKIIKQKYKNVNIIFKTFTTSNYERDLLKQIVGNSKIKVIDEYYTSKKVHDLIGKCHVLLSLHRSEGFGLTLAEAMAVNTIPIATGYSGNIDFMKDLDFLVDYKLVDVNVPFFKGQWAEPDMDDAISKIEKQICTPTEKKDLSKHLHNIGAVSNQIQNILGMPKLTEWYPEVPAAMCVEFSTSQHQEICKNILYEKNYNLNLENMFKIKDIIKPLKGYNSNKLVSTSLFYKPASFPEKNIEKNSETNLFTIEDLHIKSTTPKLKRLNKTFFELYVNNFFHNSLLDNNRDWDFRVYLANDLQCLIPFFKELNVEIVLMEHNSDYHNPGAMWRYLAMTPSISNHETVLIRELDNRFLAGNVLYKTILKQLEKPEICMSRKIQDVNNGYQRRLMPLISGGCFAFNPYKLKIKSIEKLMTGYIHFNIENDTLCIGKYPNYGFDENFLKHVIYWLVTHKSGMSTVIPSGYTNFHELQKEDLYIQKQNNCDIVYCR